MLTITENATARIKEILEEECEIDEDGSMHW